MHEYMLFTGVGCSLCKFYFKFCLFLSFKLMFCSFSFKFMLILEGTSLHGICGLYTLFHLITTL